MSTPIDTSAARAAIFNRIRSAHRRPASATAEELAAVEDYLARHPSGPRPLIEGDLRIRFREPVAVGKITELTPRLAKTYAGISAKTLQRDLAAVEEMELVERKPEGVRARRELILAFLPWQSGKTLKG